ncbi:MAG TPA: magnesium chelatase, partial [Terriglobales bacterium]
DVPAVNYRELQSTGPEAPPKSENEFCARARSSSIASLRAKRRTYANAQMGSREIRKYCDLGTEASTCWSARSSNRV